MRLTWWLTLPLESKGLGLPGVTSSWCIILMFVLFFLGPVSFQFILSICKGLKVSIATNHSLLEIDSARCVLWPHFADSRRSNDTGTCLLSCWLDSVFALSALSPLSDILSVIFSCLRLCIITHMLPAFHPLGYQKSVKYHVNLCNISTL